MRKLARARGGDCLSTEYLNNKTKLSWRCSKGHEWGAEPTTVKHSKTWCPAWARARKSFRAT